MKSGHKKYFFNLLPSYILVLAHILSGCGGKDDDPVPYTPESIENTDLSNATPEQVESVIIADDDSRSSAEQATEEDNQLGPRTPQDRSPYDVKLRLSHDYFIASVKAYADKYLMPLQSQSLDDIQLNVDDRDVLLKGVSYRSQFSNFDAKVDGGSVLASLDVSNFVINIDQLETSVVIPIVCTDIKIYLSFSKPLNVTTKINYTAKSGSLLSLIDENDIDISNMKYQVSGPAECHGAVLGVDQPLVRNSIETSFVESETDLKDYLKTAIVEQVQGLDKYMNQFLQEGLEFDYRQSGALIARYLNVKLSLDSVEFENYDMIATFETQYILSENSINPSGDLPAVLKHIKPEYSTDYAGLEITSSSINKLLSEVLLRGENSHYFDEYESSNFSSVLSKDYFAEFLPGVSGLLTDENHFEFEVAINDAPKVFLDVKKNSIGFDIDQLDFKFFAKQSGEWKSFFEANMKIGLDFEVGVSDKDELLMSFLPKYLFEVDGRWTDNFSPNNQEFYGDIVQDHFQKIMSLTSWVDTIPILDAMQFYTADLNTVINEVYIADSKLNVNFQHRR